MTRKLRKTRTRFDFWCHYYSGKVFTVENMLSNSMYMLCQVNKHQYALVNIDTGKWYVSSNSPKAIYKTVTELGLTLVTT